MLSALDLFLGPVTEFVIIGSSELDDVSKVLKAIRTVMGRLSQEQMAKVFAAFRAMIERASLR